MPSSRAIDERSLAADLQIAAEMDDSARNVVERLLALQGVRHP